VVPPKFERGRASTEGLAAVQYGGRWGFVDGAGRQVVDARFDEVFPYSQGRARVRQADRWGFVDLEGRFAVDGPCPRSGIFALPARCTR
jgi:hypothetical protein